MDLARLSIDDDDLLGTDLDGESDEEAAERDRRQFSRPLLREREEWHLASQAPEHSGMYWVRLDNRTEQMSVGWYSLTDGLWYALGWEELRPCAWASDLQDADGEPFGFWWLGEQGRGRKRRQGPAKALAVSLRAHPKTVRRWLKSGCPTDLEAAKEWLAAYRAKTGEERLAHLRPGPGRPRR